MRIALSRSLYRPDAVAAAAAAYGALARIEVAEGEHEVVVTLSDSHPDIPDLLDAFCNHALYETVLRHRADTGGVL